MEFFHFYIEKSYKNKTAPREIPILLTQNCSSRWSSFDYENIHTECFLRSG